MVYLIFDTNIWIYLANGLDTKSGKYHDNHHFVLLRKLMELQEEGDICVLVNDLIIEEWKRNKKNTETKIEQLQTKLLSLSPIKELSKYVDDLSIVKEKYIEAINAEINANRVHIALLEQFLFSNCELIPLTQDIKVKVFDLSTRGKAPFHNSKNNNADAAILFSVPSFFENHTWKYGESVMFISNNTTEYADGQNEDIFHPDILAELNGFPLQYFKRLPNALEISEDIIKEIDSYNQNKIIPVEPMQCLVAYCRYENVVFEDDVKVVYEIDINLDPNQLSLFQQTIKRTRRAFVQGGFCPHCETLYYQCPKCLEVSYANDHPSFRCFHCPTELSFNENRTGQWELLVYNSFNSSIKRKDMTNGVK